MLQVMMILLITAASPPPAAQQAVKDYVVANFPFSAGEYQFDFRRFNWPASDADLDSVTVVRMGKTSPLGSTVFTIACYRGDSLVRTASGTVDISLLMEVAVASKDILPGQPFQPVFLARRVITDDKELPITSLSDLEGKLAKVFIPENSVIYPSHCRIQPLIKAGQEVNLVSERGLVKVTARGVARQSGAKGEIVRVVNLSSRKMIKGEVIDSVTVVCR